MAGDADAAIRRVLAALETGDALDALGSQVSGADLTSFLLEVMHRRAEQRSPTDVLRRARTDRFVEPGTVDARALHRVIAAMLPAIPDAFEFVELSPVVPLGTHSTVATVHQHKIVSTVRATEAAADPTNALALLAALRRESGLPTAPTTRLGAVQRILRAQPFGAQGQQHFSVLALVTAGRDRGNRAFETDAFVEQIHALRGAIAQVTSAPVELRLTDLVDGNAAPLIDAVAATFADRPGTTVAVDPDRESGRGYYRDLCFKLIVQTPTGETECGDGGFTSWTQQLLGNRKERLLTSGLGLDRLVMVAANSPRKVTIIDRLELLDELRAIAQTGLHYATDPYDRERCTRLLDLATRGYSEALDLPEREVRERLARDLGYVSAKVGADAAIFDAEDRVLLVHRADDHAWGLISGWVDPGETPAVTIVREVREEVGLDATIVGLVDALGRPAGTEYGPHAVVSVVYLCAVDPGEIAISHESIDARYRHIDDVEIWHANHEALARIALARHRELTAGG